MKQRKSIYIKPLVILIDLFLICSIIFATSFKDYLNTSFLTYIILSWLITTYYTKFYNVYRYTQVGVIITLLMSQFFVFALAYLSYFTVFKEGEVVNHQIFIFFLILSFITFFKFFIFYILRKFRSEGKDHRTIILFGGINSAKKLKDLFHSKNDFGYRFNGFFSNSEHKSKEYLGDVKKGFRLLDLGGIDEVYCNPSEITTNQLTKIRKFAEEKDIELRILPENKAIYRKDFILEYFGTIPVLKPKPLPFEKVETHISKRILDIIFSALVCITILSWLLPILWIFIRLDSKGPLFFKQKRDGINGRQFYCFKLRSMTVNDDADKVSASKNDKRITKVGAFLRKTSLDELPQFFNVLLGDMSIVGPRPHMNAHTKKFTNEIENYLVRNSVKPGITGLAQISGYRGEVVEKSDIKNRVRLDIFYIENWSFFLDIKIIVQTFFSVFLKEEKAY
ncbi:exopolysaccharide biosynthesis polyprenyl glycosylphosphotransferase [Polaribacter reichenbachii]|uniref:Undecaprenyl-phosphate glucose phosphotransferase n=1 Tax=Polaribacter reichenbachii TaxID=996801 RepID=A0A1B8TVL6_9FLAO|nr:exopolysaccharide biosynthesis polyprenyl glycosylphosphotransferase [Polaribacter reichenbachii]OBY63657.1 undecaprenyl-phosphate glucose phosphotransferase [Polaribacter reichenbachii]